MTGRTHDLAAFTALSILVISQPTISISLGTALVALTANLIGGIAPDIDQPTAPFWNNLPIGGLIGRIFDKFLGGHRFISHSLLGLLIFGAAFYYFLQFLKPSIPHIDTQIVWLAFMVGLISHLVMDTFTKEGVPWLLPLPVNFGLPPFKSLRITTGGLIENLVIFPGLLLANFYLYYTSYGKVLDLLHHHLK